MIARQPARSTPAGPLRRSAARRAMALSEVRDRVPHQTGPGRSLVTRRAITDLVRAATLGSYGVVGTASGPLGRLLGRLGLVSPGVHVQLRDDIEIDLDLVVAYGLPVAEVARQVDSAVRYALRHGVDREVMRLTIHVDGLCIQPGSIPPSTATAGGGPAHAPGPGPEGPTSDPRPLAPGDPAPAAHNGTGGERATRRAAVRRTGSGRPGSGHGRDAA